MASTASYPSYTTTHVMQQMPTTYQAAAFPTAATYSGLPHNQYSDGYGTPEASSTAGALVLYNPMGMYGFTGNSGNPFATQARSATTYVNPFTPGLGPQPALVTPKSFVSEDPLQAKFPAHKNSDDPLNWITDELLKVRETAQEIKEHHKSLLELKHEQVYTAQLERASSLSNWAVPTV